MILRKIKEDSHHADFPELNYPSNSGMSGNCPNNPGMSGPMMQSMMPFSRGPYMPSATPESLLGGYGNMLAAAAAMSQSQSSLSGMPSDSPLPRPENVEKLRGLLDASRYSLSAQDEIVHALMTLARHNLLPGVGQNNDVITSLLVSLSAVGCLHELSNQQAEYPVSQMAAIYASSGGMMIGGNGAGGSDQGEDGGAPTRREIPVEDVLVGVILGPGGRGLREISRVSGGVHVTVSHRNEGSDNGQPRMVTLEGNLAQVDRAHRYIDELLLTEKRRRQRGGTGPGGQKRKA